MKLWNRFNKFSWWWSETDKSVSDNKTVFQFQTLPTVNSAMADLWCGQSLPSSQHRQPDFKTQPILLNWQVCNLIRPFRIKDLSHSLMILTLVLLMNYRANLKFPEHLLLTNQDHQWEDLNKTFHRHSTRMIVCIAYCHSHNRSREKWCNKTKVWTR